MKIFSVFLYDAFKWIGSLAFRRFGRKGESGTCAFRSVVMCVLGSGGGYVP